MTDDEEDLIEVTFDRGEFRTIVLRYVKQLIRARWKCDPSFFSDQDLIRWKLANIRKDEATQYALLMGAAADLATINTEFIPRCGTGGILRYKDPATRQLIEDIAFLAHSNAHGPYHNDGLLKAADQVANEEAVNWVQLVHWDWLLRIRNALDEFTDTKAVVPSTSLTIEVTGDSNAWLVTYDGKRYPVEKKEGLILRVLKDNIGHSMSGSEIKALCPELILEERLDRVIKKLREREPFGRIIETSPRGTRLKIEVT